MPDFLDDAPERAPDIPRISNTGHADEVDRALGGKLDALSTEQRANLAIPTPQEVNRAGTKGDAQEVGTGLTQDQISLSRLSDELGNLKAKAAKIRARGDMVPDQLMQEITAKKNSIDFQYDRMQRNATDPAVEEFKRDQELLLSAYKRDMEFAVMNMMREERVNKEHAERLVHQKREKFGDAEVLPQYARIDARMAQKYPTSTA